jgi:hypothetical protein
VNIIPSIQILSLGAAVLATFAALLWFVSDQARRESLRYKRRAATTLSGGGSVTETFSYDEVA